MKRRAIEYQADMADQDVIGSTNSCEADCGHRVGGALWCRNLPAPHRRWESEGVGVSRRFLGSWPHGPGNLCEAAGALWLGSDARGLRGTVLDGEGRRRAAGLVSTGLRAMLVRSTSTRHRIRHGIRHTAARAGRGLCPCVANGRLRHMLIGYARVSKTDGSQSRLILRCLLPELDVRWRRPRPLRGRLHSTLHQRVDVLTHWTLVTPRRFFQAIPAIHQ